MKINQRSRDHPHSRILKSSDREKIAMEKEVTNLKIQVKKKEAEIELHQKKEKISRQRFQRIDKRRGFHVTEYEKKVEKKTKRVAELQAKNRVLEDDNVQLKKRVIKKDSQPKHSRGLAQINDRKSLPVTLEDNQYEQMIVEFEKLNLNTKLRAKNQNLKLECKKITSEYVQSEDTICELEKNVDDIEAKCSTMESENNSLIEKISRLERSHLQKTEESESKCQVLEADKMKLQQQLDASEFKCSILETENTELKESRDAANTNVQSLTDKISHLEHAHLQQTEKSESKCRALEADKMEFERKFEDLKRQLHESDFSCGHLEAINGNLKEDYENSKKIIRHLIEKFSHLEQSHLQLEQQIDVLKRKLFICKLLGLPFSLFV